MKRDIWEEGIRPTTPKEEECWECDGVGIFEIITGSRMCAGQGGPYEPITREEGCEVCRGSGRKLCEEHHQPAVACWIKEPSDILCEDCLEELGTTMEEVKMEVIQRAAQDPMIQSDWGREPT